MKNFFFILVMVFLVSSISAVQPARKPFLQIKIDGKACKNGDVLTVTAGQKLMMGVELEGGRRDFCKFPDTYADIAGTAQILSRGNDGLTYQLDGIRSEWKLLSESARFSADEFIKSTTQNNPSTAELIISNSKFSQSFVKISFNSIWQFSQNGKTTEEENLAEATIYFKIAGTSDLWFTSQNVQASGMKNELVQEKLNAVQAQFDSIENNFYKLKFSVVQQSVKTLQTAVNEVKTTIDEVKTTNPSYQSKIVFIGLPSDKPFSDIGLLTTLKTSWGDLETLLQDIKLQVVKLPAQPTKESKDELVRLIGKCADWQYKLPENTFKVLPRYLADLKPETIQIPGNIHFIAEEKTVTDYAKTISDLNAFLDQRIEQIPNEIQKISSTQSRLQVVRLFDGNLRSYFSSINWAEWKNTRE
jgi:hypothetical protein